MDSWVYPIIIMVFSAGRVMVDNFGIQI